ncbi:MAG: HAD-IB family phosphatase [Gemmatimonadaceae bacterium]
MRPKFASVVFDADSTLASIEGIDWLGARRGLDVGRNVQDLTTRAMAGELPLEQVYALRLDAIRPTRKEISLLSDAYVAAVEPGALKLLEQLRDANVTLAIVSGGLRAALLPLANMLSIPQHDVYAVDLIFDDNGEYASLAASQPLSQQLGKPIVVRGLNLPRRSVMIGDGSTDAAVRGDTDEFIAYTRVARRELVVASADAEARDFGELTKLLFESAAHKS